MPGCHSLLGFFFWVGKVEDIWSVHQVVMVILVSFVGLGRESTVGQYVRWSQSSWFLFLGIGGPLVSMPGGHGHLGFLFLSWEGRAQLVSMSGGHGHLGFFFWVWGDSWSVYQVVTVILVFFSGLGKQKIVGQYVRWSQSSWFLFLGWEGRKQLVSTSGGHGHLSFFFWVWGGTVGQYARQSQSSWVSFSGLGRERTFGQYVRWSWSSWFLFLGIGGQLVSMPSGHGHLGFLFLGWEGRAQLVSMSGGHGHLGFFFWVWGDSWSVYQVVTVILVSFPGLGKQRIVGQYVRWSQSSWFLFLGWEGRKQLVSTSGGHGHLGFFFWVWGGQLVSIPGSHNLARSFSCCRTV